MADFSFVPVDHDPFADDYQVQTPLQDLAKLYANNGGLGTIQDYVRRSGEALARIPSELGHNVYGLLEAAGTNVALPSLQRSQELYDTDWSKQPFIGIGEHGEFTGRLPALAEATVPYLAGGAPGGSLGAGMKLPGGYEGGYHGTPHTFAAEEGHPLGRFKDEAIGTGEGNQSFGYGHYVAGAKDVADTYNPGRSSQTGPTFMGNSPQDYLRSGETYKSLSEMWPVDAREFVHQARGDIDKAISLAGSSGENYAPGGQAIKKWIEENREHLGYQENLGNLYHVEIKPQEHELLDWDKPLSEQSPQVQAKLKKLGDHPLFPKYDPTVSGSDFYDVSADRIGSPSTASQVLHEAGIPGIKYLDAGSRNLPDVTALKARLAGFEEEYKYIVDGPDFPGKAEGLKEYAATLEKQREEVRRAENPTYNYVIFHPDNLRVVGKNGEPIENYLKDIK